ncbi:formate dehydrogenase accessory sulfurtransferase FdhD [Verrucomicrobiota bacterium]
MKANKTEHNIVRSTEVAVSRYRPGGPHEGRSRASVISEFPLTIRINDDSFTVMRTPGDDRDLVTGFLFTEGLIESLDDINMLSQCQDNPHVVTVKTKKKSGNTPRNMIITSSCGLCGHENIQALLESLKQLDCPMKMPLDVLFRIPDQVKKSQVLFSQTGGAHAAALFDAKGNLQAVREDVGRHNALDKLLGHAILSGIATGESGIFLSGRVSLELIVKVVRVRMPLVAAVSAPTAAAVQASDRLGITLCGFVRGNEVSVYTNGWRIVS